MIGQDVALTMGTNVQVLSDGREKIVETAVRKCPMCCHA